MDQFDLRGLDVNQLEELQRKAQTEIVARNEQKCRELREQLERRVAAEGYKMSDIFPELGGGGGAAGGRKRRKVAPKYRNPQNAQDVWTGLGRPPKWVQEVLNERGISAATFKTIPMYQIDTAG